MISIQPPADHLECGNPVPRHSQSLLPPGLRVARQRGPEHDKPLPRQPQPLAHRGKDDGAIWQVRPARLHQNHGKLRAYSAVTV